MSNAIPNPEMLLSELDRCRKWAGAEAADWCAEAVAHDWEHAKSFGVHQGAWTAVSLMYRAARLRQRQRFVLADTLTGCAHAAVLGWADNVVVRAWVADLADLPEAPDPNDESPVRPR